MAVQKYLKHRENFGFVNVEPLLVITLLGISTAIGIEIGQRYELTWYWVVLLIAAIACGIVASVTGIGLICMRVSDKVVQRRRDRQGRVSMDLINFLTLIELLLVPTIFSIPLIQQLQLSFLWLPLFVLGGMVLLLLPMFLLHWLGKKRRAARKRQRAQ